MARQIKVRQLSGKEESFQVSIRTTVSEFKRQLHGWLHCADESKRNMSSVEVVVGDRPLLNSKEMGLEAIPGTEVLAFLSIKPVTCSSFLASGVEPGDLRVVEISEGVTEIENYAFQDCWSLASVTISDSVTWIGERAFAGCRSLASVTIPHSVTVIAAEAFRGCTSLARVTQLFSGTLFPFFLFDGCPTKNCLFQKGFPFFPGSLSN